MKIIVISFTILFSVLATYADEVEYHTIEIQHPRLGKSPQPLVITETMKYCNMGEHGERYKYWPMVYDRYSVTEGKESIIGSDDQWNEYYDAFPTLDRRNYILVRRWGNPEWSRLLEIKLGRKVLKNPEGEKIFWSNDGKYLVTAIMPSAFSEHAPALYLYDFGKKGNKVELDSECLFDDTESLQLYIKEHLVCAEDNEDVKLIIKREKSK